MVLVASGVAVSSAALAATSSGDPPLLPFTEEANQRGIDYVPSIVQPFGDGVIVADLDGDGDPDIVATGAGDGRLGLFENNGRGVFVRHDGDIAPIAAIASVVAGDVDRDGDLDLYVSRWGEENVLLSNLGNWSFADTTAVAGVAASDAEHASATFGDFDGDGWLDLYVCAHPGSNTLYRNAGDGTFTDVTANHPAVAATEQHTFQATFLDHDRDGDPDLYLANSYGQHCADLPFRNLLFENVGGTFVDVTEAANALACVDAMCIGLGDIDGNGHEDIYVTDNNEPGNALLLNQGDGTYVEDAAGWGVESFATSWGSVMFDFDHDGRLDLYVCNSSGTIPNRLYHGSPRPPLVDRGPELGVGAEGPSRSASAGDFDGDGDLDLVVSTRNQPLRLFINHEGTRRSSVRYDVRDRSGGQWASNVFLSCRTGRQTQVRELVTGTGYKAQHEAAAFFGLGDAASVDRLDVMWAWGGVRTLSNYPANERWTIHHPDRLGDANGDGQWDAADAAALLAAAGPVAPGTEALDLDGNAVINGGDATRLLERIGGIPADCNGDGVPDLVELANGAGDVDGDGIPDNCQAIPGDLDGDLAVGPADLTIVLDAWGTADGAADVDGNGTVGFGDVLMLLAHWS
ncbi:MAG: CRTAC1 family protein [Phycisphaerales bacterium]